MCEEHAGTRKMRGHRTASPRSREPRPGRAIRGQLPRIRQADVGAQAILAGSDAPYHVHGTCRIYGCKVGWMPRDGRSEGNEGGGGGGGVSKQAVHMLTVAYHSL